MTNTIFIALMIGIAISVVLFIMSRPSNDAPAKLAGKRRAAMATSVTVGAALGAALGAAMDNMGFGVAIGVAVGVAIGTAHETRLR